MNDEEKKKLMGIKESVSDELRRVSDKMQGIIIQEDEEDLERMLEELDYAEERIEQIKDEIQSIGETE